MDLRILTTPEEFAAIREDWNSLVDRSVYPNFFLRAEWLLAWWKWFGQAIGAYRFLLVYDADELVGGFPLFRQRGGKLKIQGYDGLTCPEYLGLVVLPDHIEPVVKTLVDYLAATKDWTELFFEDYTVEDPGTAYFAQCLKRRFPNWEYPGEPRYYIPLPETYDDYLKTRSSSNRWRKKNSLRKAKELYHAELREIGAEDIDHWFPLMQKLSLASVGRKVARPSLLHKPFEAMFRELLRELLPRREARLFFMYYEGIPVAFQLGFSYKNKFYYYQVGCNPKHPGRPGDTTTQYALIRFIEEGYREFDFLRGTEDYKLRWTDLGHDTENLYLFRRKAFSYYHRLFLDRIARPAYRCLKRLFTTRNRTSSPDNSQ